MANHDMDILQKWCASNRLSVNYSKTYYMLFSNKSLAQLPPLIFSNNIIKRTSQHKLLGVTLDDHITFKSHISEVCLKVSRIVALLYQVRDLVPNYMLHILYNAHILPHLLYCITLWGNTYPTHLLPLFRLQKRS